MASTRRFARHLQARGKALSQSGLGVLSPRPSEAEAAKYAVSKGLASSLNTLANAAYALAYPEAPQGPGQPDFYDATQTKWINAWVRIRDYVDVALSAQPPQPIQQGALPPPLESLHVPFAVGAKQPAWPVVPSDPRGCAPNYLDVLGGSHGERFQRFLAPRGLKRYHLGHDCLANFRDIVVAPEDAVVGKINQFVETTDAVWLHTLTGLTLILGETLPGSPAEFGVQVGSRVTKGQPVARVGTFAFAQAMKMHMVHFETHEGHKLGYTTWHDGASPPPALRNPTQYLLRALSTCKLKLGLQAPMGAAELANLGRVVMGTNMLH